MMETSIDKKYLGKQIYDILKTQIIENKRKPGEKLSIADIANELGVSRSPVVMAVSALEHDRFVVVLPQRGSFVRELTYEELNAIYRTRAAFERMIVENSIHRVNSDELVKFKNKFALYMEKKDFDLQTLRELFYLEMDFHAFLYTYFPEIIRCEFNKVSELTKRSRFLNLEYKVNNNRPQEIKEKDVNIHIQLIDAMLKGNVSMAADIAEQDVMLTCKSALKFLYPGNDTSKCAES